MSLFQTLVTRHSGTPLGSPALVRRRKREEQLLDKEDKKDKEDKEEVDKCGKEILGLLSPVVIR